MTDITSTQQDRLIKLIGQPCKTKDTHDFPELAKDDERCFTCVAWEAIEVYVAQKIARELKLIKTFASGYDPDPRYTKYPFYVIEKHAIDDRIKQLTNNIGGKE